MDKFSFINYMNMPLSDRLQHTFHNCKKCQSIPIWYAKLVNKIARDKVDNNVFLAHKGRGGVSPACVKPLCGFAVSLSIKIVVLKLST